MGADISETIRWFVTNKKTLALHFRNVSSPLPCFLAAFPDSGYYDMHKAMKALVDGGYGGVVHLDHTPAMGRPVRLPGLCHRMHEGLPVTGAERNRKRLN